MICELQNCSLKGTYKCSRCKNTYYCCVEHQKLHWKEHKSSCNSSSISKVKLNEIQQDEVILDKNIIVNASNDKRMCRCMFCGNELILTSEEEAITHMRICSSLQEQLSSKDQFTIPSIIKNKYKTNDST